MSVGRPPKPTQIKKLQGTDQPCRTLKNEMQPEAISLPECPAWLNDYAQDEWYIVTGELEALKMLSAMDIAMLASYCQQIAIIRIANEQLKSEDYALVVDTPNGALQPNPLLGIINKATDVALKIAGQFGFTPAARTRIRVPEKPPEDPFTNYLTGN